MINFFLKKIPSFGSLRNTIVSNNKNVPACTDELILLLFYNNMFQGLGAISPDWMKIGDYNGTDTIKVYKLFSKINMCCYTHFNCIATL